MTQARQFMIGAEVSCTDGVCGHLTRVVINPASRTVTDLVVEPEHRTGLARLVPVELAIPAVPASDGIGLRCTLNQFAQFDPAEETQFVPGTRGYEVYGPEQVLSQPYYRLGDTVMDPDHEGKVSETVTVDTVPLGEVEVRRGETVLASDGAIGQVEGLVVNPDGEQVTHVLLREGHLWGRRPVAIPIKAVTSVDDEGIQLSITKDEARDLPEVPVADW
jgi:sporulation protein YlmC with PRC-barrel domain